MDILTDQKKSFFDTFGFLAFPDLLADCIDEIIALLKTQIAARARFWNDRAYGKIMLATAGPERKKHLTQVMAHDDHLAELSARAREEMPEPSRG